MTAPGRYLPTPHTVNDEHLAAILGVLDEIRDTLRDRLPANPDGEPVRTSDNAEPAISTEVTPEPEPVLVQEPAPARPSRTTTRGKARR